MNNPIFVPDDCRDAHARYIVPRAIHSVPHARKSKFSSTVKSGTHLHTVHELKYPLVIHSAKHMQRLAREKIFTSPNGIKLFDSLKSAYNQPYSESAHTTNNQGPNFKWVPKSA